MDIQTKAEDILRFFKRCNCSDLIKDLICQTENSSLVGRFATKERYMYGEVYIPSLKVEEEGTLAIPRIKQLINVASRFDDGLIRIITKTTEDGTPVYALTNGKVDVKMLQTDDAGICESFESIPTEFVMFDKDTLNFAGGKVVFKNGCSIDYAMLNEIIKDATAFSYERYEFRIKKNKKSGSVQLVCAIVNEHTGEKFTRVVANNGFIGNVEEIPTVIVGGGFKEIVKTIVANPEPIDEANKEQQPKVSMYFDTNAILITDGKSFYYTLNTYEENNE